MRPAGTAAAVGKSRAGPSTRIVLADVCEDAAVAGRKRLRETLTNAVWQQLGNVLRSGAEQQNSEMANLRSYPFDLICHYLDQKFEKRHRNWIRVHHALQH